MIETLYETIAIPDSCRLGARVYKKLFHEKAKLGVTDKKAFRDDIDAILWQYSLKPGTIAIQAYEDDHREYFEINVLQIDLKSLNRTRRIAEVIHRAIPYPLVLIFAYEETCSLSLAHKRFSQATKEAVVADDIMMTGWISLKEPAPTESAFLKSLHLSGLPHTHFYALYTALTDRLTALACSGRTGVYSVITDPEQMEERRSNLSKCHELEMEINSLRAALKNETQFNRRVELMMKLRELEQQLRTLTSLL